ncbi:hypothetical protein [Vibrio parahaemolyticus]|uniref:hypothetical protein n=1 Tax=Vibrio parahaemolyticus TaxID=670 RepID=UPI00111DB300|nr:hypothetical protein [Vibrio parahaemolyticus]EHH1241878.1 hypothetical protein [Vibrio parahaemolyticus]EHR6782965.1 hypothetical protein [Vibrio parahaemolyticus]MDG2804765.1 hypothetical protein [Vibrio parahaemolyticus]MDG3027286.1 hypothetical protein [Vibrio parahaemolyticus]TOH24869.1 hypothetical protein CGI83_23530 [Vibrio parahaemolyticus]
MKLYKYVPEEVVAKSISCGVFRFYELLKYVAIEDDVGRSDASECSVNFPRHEWENDTEALPVLYIGDVKVHYTRISPSKEHIAQYFVFCSSFERTDNAILDTRFMVEFDANVFDIFEFVLKDFQGHLQNENLKIFSHGKVSYYSLKEPPKTRLKSSWEEVYLKHQDYSYQNEYRATLCIPDFMFDMATEETTHLRFKINDKKGEPLDFDLTVDIRGGIDSSGWRFIEIDISEFTKNIGVQSVVTDLSAVESAS